MVKDEKRLSGASLFAVVMLATIGIGLTVSYCSGIFGSVPHASALPFRLPKWLVIALPPVLYVHLGLALFLVLRENVYTDSGRMVRGWLWAFWIATFIATSMTPYFVYRGMTISSYVLSSITTAMALGTTILSSRQSAGAGVVMSIFFIVVSLLMVYLGFWAFA